MIENSFRKIVIPASLAIFAMFFGAGNLVFPLSLGANSAHMDLYTLTSGFLLSGIGLPILGLIATILCKGDYQEILSTFGKTLGIIMASIIVALLGLFISNPRSCVIAYSTLSGYLPQIPHSTVLFKLVFFTLVFFATRYQEKVVNLIGKLLSPIKISMIILVIIIGAMSGHTHQSHFEANTPVFTHALITGYGTLDLLASLFFARMIYHFVTQKVTEYAIPKTAINKIAVISTLIGMSLVGIVYIGFLYVANLHANLLQGISTVSVLTAANHILFNNFTAILFNVSIAVACFVTSIALTSITSSFIHEKIVSEKISYTIVLTMTTIIAFGISNFTFNEIMHIGSIVLNVLYPLILIITAFKLFQAFKLYIHNKKLASLP